MVFNTLIGNADMHLKNWSLIYLDKHRAQLSPAYDFVSTISYIEDQKAALKYSKTKKFDEFTLDELKRLCAIALIPEKVAVDTAKETVALFHEHWQKEKSNFPLYNPALSRIDNHLKKLPIAIL